MPVRRYNLIQPMFCVAAAHVYIEREREREKGYDRYIQYLTDSKSGKVSSPENHYRYALGRAEEVTELNPSGIS